MRFSLKWILAGVAYVAIAAAAFSQTTWVYADILWAASLLAVVYAALVAAFLRGRRQIAAAGFVVGSFCFLLCLTLGGDSVPTTRLLVAAGVGQSNQPGAPPATATASWALTPSNSATLNLRYGGPPKASSFNSTLGIASSASPPATASGTISGAGVNSYAVPMIVAAPSAFPPIDFGIYVRAGNAAGMMVIGLMGSVVGVIVYRSARRANSVATNPIS